MNIVRLNNDSKIKYINQLLVFLGDDSKRLIPEAMECLVAVKGDESLGFIVINFSDESVPLIECIYVAPNVRYTGIGKALLDAAELMCIVSGYESLSFVSYKKQPGNNNIFDYDVDLLIGFFESNGYFLTEVDIPGEDFSIVRGNRVF